MTEQHTNLPSPIIKQSNGFSLVWLIPLLTLLIGGWLVIKTLAEQGSKITITFQTANGIQAGKTQIRYKNVQLGMVNSIAFSKDLSQVILSAEMQPDTDKFLRRDTSFWVIRPRLSLSGVSGLDTLVSGAYIEIAPGQGAAQSHYVGLEEPPVVDTDLPGKEILLLTHNLRSIGPGSPIYYQGIQAGEVSRFELGNDRRSVFIYAFIHSPYDELVQGNTRFWNVSGLDVTMDSDGLKVRTESLKSLMFGGISFETPINKEAIKDDMESLVFTLHDNYDNIKEQAFSKKLRFVMYFNSSVRGLNIGAPVEFKGIKIGSVVDVRLEYNRQDNSFMIPVYIEIEPERVVDKQLNNTNTHYAMLDNLVADGLRASLQTGSLLTGQLFVQLDMHNKSIAAHFSNEKNEVPEIPTIAGGLDSMRLSVQSILTQLENIDIQGISKHLKDTLKGSSELVNGGEISTALSHVETSLKSFQDIMSKVETRVEPIAINLEEALKTGNDFLKHTDTTLRLMDTLLKPNSPVQYNLIQMTSELAETARSIRTLVELLERNPEALLYGKNRRGE